MAASVRIEDEAFSDARIEHLGALLGSSKYDALGRLAYLWRQATAMGKDVLPEPTVSLIVDVAKLVECGLAVEVRSGVRLKGAKGRIDWLARKREAGRQHGHKGGAFGVRGGRPPSGITPLPGSEGVRKNPPPAPAPAPAQKTKDPPNPPFASEAFGDAWADWVQHRQEKGVKLTPLAVKKQFKKLAAIGEARSVAAIEHSIANGYQGIYEPNQNRPAAGKQSRADTAIDWTLEAANRSDAP